MPPRRFSPRSGLLRSAQRTLRLPWSRSTRSRCKWSRATSSGYGTWRAAATWPLRRRRDYRRGPLPPARRARRRRADVASGAHHNVLPVRQPLLVRREARCPAARLKARLPIACALEVPRVWATLVLREFRPPRIPPLSLKQTTPFLAIWTWYAMF